MFSLGNELVDNFSVDVGEFHIETLVSIGQISIGRDRQKDGEREG